MACLACSGKPRSTQSSRSSGSRPGFQQQRPMQSYATPSREQVIRYEAQHTTKYDGIRNHVGRFSYQLPPPTEKRLIGANLNSFPVVDNHDYPSAEAYYNPNSQVLSSVQFAPFACINSMPCSQKYLNTKLPDGNTIGYYLQRNRLMSNQMNNLPFYDPYDPTVMWTKPNDYVSS